MKSGAEGREPASAGGRQRPADRQGPAPEETGAENPLWTSLATGAALRPAARAALPPADPVIRRQAVDGASAAPATLLVDDGVVPGPGQLAVGDYLREVRKEVCRAVEDVLAPTGRTTDDCPYLDLLFPFLERQSAAETESILRRFAPEILAPASARRYTPLIAKRARESTERWVATGEITGLPEGLPTSLETLIRWAVESRGKGTPPVLRKALPGVAGEGTHAVAVQSRLGAGRPLEGPVRGRMESAFGVGFSNVRVHTDAGAQRLSAELKARAFAVGGEVAFGAGEYRPGTPAGDALIAHELAHVVQQRGAGPRVEGDDERDADRAALEAMQGRAARPGGVGGLRLQRCSTEGSGYEPEEHEEYHAAPPTPEEMIEQHTTDLGDLDEDKLGKTLADMAWYTPLHHNYIRRVFDALDWGDRDDVAAAMISHTRDADLVDIARTEEGRALLKYLVPELTEGWTWPGGDTYAAVRALRALSAQQSATEAVKTELESMRQAVGATKAPADAPVETLTRAQIEERLRLVEAHLQTFERRWSADPKVMAAVNGVKARVATARSTLATDGPAISRSVQIAQQVLETCEVVIGEIDRQIGGLSEELARRGTEDANIQLLTYVRARYVEALGAAMGPDATLRFAQAAAALQQLTLSQVQIELAVLKNRPGLFESVKPKLTAMNAFAGSVVTELRALEVEERAIRAAEQAGTDVKSRRAAGERRLRGVMLSHRVLTHWEVVIQVAEALESGFSFTEVFYGNDVSVDSLHTRLAAMATLFTGGNYDALAKALEGYEGDKRIQEYYEDVPKILRSSGLVVAIAVMVAAAVVTWGAGALLAPAAGAGAGAVAGGTASTITAGGIAAGAGTAFLNALIFTSVHRGLSEITGLGVKGSFFEDLLWNFGLFGVLRVVGKGVQMGLQARGLAHLAAPIQAGTAFAMLEVYGVARFRIEEGRFPTAAEFASMTAQTIVIMAAMMVVHATIDRFSALGRFQARWGSQFEEIRLEQKALERDAQRALEEGRTGEFEAKLKERGKALEGRLKALVDKVIAEGDIKALRTELSGMLGMEAAQAALTESMGLLPEVALQRAGTPSQFSYRHGETARLTEGLTGLGAKVRVIESASGQKVVEATFGDRPSLYFAERAVEAAPAPAAPASPPPTPAEAAVLRLDAARDALLRRRIPWSRVPKDLQDLETARPRAQGAKTLEKTAARLTRLEAWIAEQTETPWQLGREVKVEVTEDGAKALAQALPADPFRSHLEANPRAAIVYGALNETSPKALPRMRALWDAWINAGQEGVFAEFAESRLVEEGAAALRASGDNALAALLQADARVQNAFGRMGYDVARLRAVYLYHQHGYAPASGAKLEFAEYVQHEVGSLGGRARAWGERRAGMAIAIPDTGFEPLRTRLADLRSAGTLTETDAGIVWRWNAMIEGLINDSASLPSGAAPGASRATTILDHLLQGLGKNFSESSYREFRVRIRNLVVDDIIFTQKGAGGAPSPATSGGRPVRAWADQNTRLEAWEGRVPSGDSATIGAIWTAYAQARFQLGLPTGSTAAGIKTIPGRNLRLPDGRMGDAALGFGKPAVRGAPAEGEWAADYKGGVDPHDIAQSRNYSTNMVTNGGNFSMGGNIYRGLLLIFRSATAADGAAKALNAEGLHANLKVGYFSSTGEIVWLR